jgi:hypothetical protein
MDAELAGLLFVQAEDVEDAAVGEDDHGGGQDVGDGPTEFAPGGGSSQHHREMENVRGAAQHEVEVGRGEGGDGHTGQIGGSGQRIPHAGDGVDDDDGVIALANAASGSRPRPCQACGAPDTIAAVAPRAAPVATPMRYGSASGLRNTPW